MRKIMYMGNEYPTIPDNIAELPALLNQMKDDLEDLTSETRINNLISAKLNEVENGTY